MPRHGYRYILKKDSFVWILENKDSLTPLQLSAKLGVVEIFQFIINLKNVYSFDSSHDGLFDVKLYDITEIDTVANQHIASITNADEGYGNKKCRNKDCNSVKCSQFYYPKTESILEMMFGYDYQSQSAFRIIENHTSKEYHIGKMEEIEVYLFHMGISAFEDLFCLSCIRHIFGSTGIEKEILGLDPVSKEIKVYSRYFLKIHSLQTTYASEEDREAMENMMKEKEPMKTEESLRSDKDILNHLSKIIK
ncbi:TRPV3 [Mytilus coruscus]|uniref:TRPV3 n=1 Tax=Mytilus coruscus TaxID=42192 RepID=A0A6J8EAN3_MYTCO|nr:TRPV3 [Mytilus coruscus]